MAENRTAGPGHHGLLWLAGGILFAMGLIALGVLPASCGKNLPRVGRYYQQYCDDCGGDGKVSRSCPSCFGRGYYGGTRCSTCNGQEGAQSCVPVGTVPHFFPSPPAAGPAIQPALPAVSATNSSPMQIAPQPMATATTSLLGPSSTVRNIVLILGGGTLALLLVCAGIVTLALFAGRGASGPAGPPRAPAVVPPSAQPGTITFAEFVDSRTFATRNEGREFSTGWVWILVRSGKPFGDTRMVISYRESDSAVSTILTEAAIDPNWDTAADRIRLILPGTYVITATNSRGEQIAQDIVRITP